MLSDFLRLAFLLLRDTPAFALSLLHQRLAAIYHRKTYTPLSAAQTKTVLVLGGSFAGFQTARRLTQTLPSGYRVVLVEQTSHLNYVFAFPRFSVVKGHEALAFIPYTGLAAGAPPGIFERVQGRAVRVAEREVWLETGEVLAFEYLVVATGTTASGMPTKVAAVDAGGAQAELRAMQEEIEAAERIAVVGGGAVGVELASDVKDVYPGKSVVLVHSGERLLPRFGGRLQEYVVRRLETMGVEVWLNQRVKFDEGGRSLTLGNGKEEVFDLVIPCLGQGPNSLILNTLSPASISKTTSEILVRSTLQIVDERFPHIFAIGDVAATGGPKMGRAATVQSEVVVHNILTLIAGKGSTKNYKPLTWIEGSIKLTMGISHIVMYAREDNGKDILIPLNVGKEDMDVTKQWRLFGVEASSAQNAVAAAK